MASSHPPRPAPLRRSALCLAALCSLAAPARSQQPAAPAAPAAAASAAETTPEVVTITGRASPPAAGIGGFGDLPAARTPFQALSLSSATLADLGATNIADLIRVDAGIGDAYNAPGYWSALTVRGFILDNRFNYRRDGLPINAETAIALENKERIEVLKGTSGAQAGTSAPGGLANVVVKRPLADNRRSVLLGWEQDGSLKAAADINQRFGADGAAGLRINAAAERLDPSLEHSRGERYLLAAAGEARLSPGDLVEAEVEWSRQSQPSAPGFSVLGNSVPSAHRIDPDLNLNNQAWAQPVVFEGTTASLRWTHTLPEGWRVVAHAMAQQLRTDDRIAFPYGCSAENVYDRYCSDGSFDLYDYRSDGERRRSLAGALSLEGEASTGPLHHQLSTGIAWSRYRARFNMQAYNYVGTGNIDGDYTVPDDPTLTGGNTNRDERSTELHLRDAIRLADPLTLWLGVRHTRLTRDSAGLDGSEPQHYQQSFTTPWLALSHQLTEGLMAYASWGEGVESDVAPNRPNYTNAGQALPALKSRQWEVGLKGEGSHGGWSVTAFDIRRPQTTDDCIYDDEGGSLCTRRIDGNARHRGVEIAADTRLGAWALRSSALWLKARREGGTLDGLTPPNVAERALKLQGEYRVAQLPGLSLLANLAYEGPRWVLPDDSLRIGGWTRVDLGLRHGTRWLDHALTLRFGVDNAFDRRAWKEAPYQFSHAYLYPLAPRTWRASLQADF